MLRSVKSIVAVIALAVFATGSIATSAQAADMKSWQKAVVKKVIKEQVYPRSAVINEVEGKAKIRLTVSSDGKIVSHEVVQPTGQDLLDSEIPGFVNRLNPLPALPDGKTELSFILPLTWTLE